MMQGKVRLDRGPPGVLAHASASPESLLISKTTEVNRSSARTKSSILAIEPIGSKLL
jgi:hypothetical protein